ncbi:hypothetical protein DFP73DRAFT_203897 [Morchella snyderi]|nr:hypothetical protein DFP73DRAFT_203897 [Morchella snyderi]
MASTVGKSRTGTNATPLGQRRLQSHGERDLAVDDPKKSAWKEQSKVNLIKPERIFNVEISESVGDGVKRGRSERRELPDGRKRKKANRWGAVDENKVAGLMGLPTVILTPMTSEQLDAYTIHLRVEEITQKLKIGDIVPDDGNRSLSPAPIYDSQGRRINTREYRYRKRLEDERHKLIQKANTVFSNYHAPSDYRRPAKTIEKIYVPVNDYPEINFIGLLIGPRGNTLKRMESESGAKIAIRGKGSVKEGKGASDRATDSNLDEDLHCLIIADTEGKIELAKKAILEVIETVN